MSWLGLDRIANLVNGRLLGQDVPVEGVYTDTRKLAQGRLFVALKGPRFDAHEFVRDDLAAAGVMVSRPCETRLPQVIVEDTKAALGRLSANWRAGLDLPVIGLTGSNGKTTVKEMTASILSVSGSVLATRGNLNNDIGVPLTLLELRAGHERAVIEMGANHPGEIAYLTSLVRPTIAMVTNAGPAHLEGFGTIEGVSRAKGEIYAGLREDGVALINADDTYADYWRGLVGEHRVLSFGLDAPADISAQPADRDRWEITTPAGAVVLRLPLPGRHNLMNALAATAASLAAGATPEQVRDGLESMRPVDGRMQQLASATGLQLIDDTYNANPGSLSAALEVLAAAPGERWLILGDMGELGSAAAEIHRSAGRQAREAGIERLYALGPLSREAVGGFGEGAAHFERLEDLCEALRGVGRAGVTALVKGSRSMRMERVVECLRDGGGSERG
jgi:UDP-N-acetylmuramoyl-tripeptide--D-alanyl-D-alanine ligase